MMFFGGFVTSLIGVLLIVPSDGWGGSWLLIVADGIDLFCGALVQIQDDAESYTAGNGTLAVGLVATVLSLAIPGFVTLRWV